jgi:hypothetical protein
MTFVWEMGYASKVDAIQTIEYFEHLIKLFDPSAIFKNCFDHKTARPQDQNK